MRITGSNLHGIIPKQKNEKLQPSSKAGAAPIVSSKDEIKIAKAPAPQSMPDFTAALSKRLAAEVQQGVSQHDAQKLQGKLQLGQYYININSIAKKMLLDQDN